MQAADGMNTVLDIQGLRKVYRRGRKEVMAVDGISLAVAPGSVVGLLGPNGAGKTTTIKCALGLVEPTAGAITIAGFDVRRRLGQALRHVGAVLEGSRTIYLYLTALENLVLFANLAGIATAEAHRRALGLLERFGLQEKAHARGGELSRGMQQKLAICAALIRDPRVLLLDEPTLGLDVETAMQMRGLLVRLAREQECAIVVSSHQMELIEAICERVVIMQHGRIIADDRVAGLLQLFATRSYRFRTEQALTEAAFERLCGSFPAARVTNDGAGVVVDVAFDHGQQLYEVMDILRAGNCTLASIEHRTPDLEQVFLRLLQGSAT